MGSTKTSQQRYLEKVVRTESCACGCGGTVEVKRGQLMPSYLRRRKHPGFFLPGHNVVLDAGARRAGASYPFGPEARAWKGGRRVRVDGRTEERVDGKYVLTYRLEVERTLGRKLDSAELIHHLNGDVLDDRIKNLTLTTRADHARLHDLDRERDGAGRFI